MGVNGCKDRGLNNKWKSEATRSGIEPSGMEKGVDCPKDYEHQPSTLGLQGFTRKTHGIKPAVVFRWNQIDMGSDEQP